MTVNPAQNPQNWQLTTNWTLSSLATSGDARTTTYANWTPDHRERYTPLAEIASEFLAAQKPVVSVQGYTSLVGMIRRVLAWFESQELDVCQIRITDAVAYQAWLGEQSLGTGTVHNYLKAARRFFDHLVATERRRDNPFKELRFPRLPVHLSRNILTEAQMGRLLAELAKWDTLGVWYARERRYRTHVVAELLYSTGLRIAEACSLTPENLDLENRRIWIPSGKGGKPRTAFLTGYAAGVMQEYLARGRGALLHAHNREMHGQTLFGANKARVAEVVNGELEAVCLALELPLITSHGFRHSLGTHLLRSGCDMRHIQVILGHEALATTQIYTRVDKDDLKRSLDEFHPRQFDPRGPL
jgi:integrase/recombinase XerD